MLKRNTVVLMLLAIGLAVAVLVLNQADQQRQEQQEQESRLLGFAPEEVTQIQIETPGEEGTQTIRLVRTEADWQIQEPIDSEADAATVESLLTTAAEISPAADLEQTEADADLEAFGLDPAQEILRFTLAEGQELTLTLGDQDFDGTGIYALADEGRLVTIPRSSQGRLSPDLFALRDKTLVSLNRAQIRSLEIRYSAEARADETPILLTRTDSGWQIQQPRPLRADPSAIDQLINPLLTLQASGFAAETQADLEDFGLEAPATELIITLDPPAEPTQADQEPENSSETEETEETEKTEETKETEETPAETASPPEPIRIALGNENPSGSGIYVITSTSPTVATLAPATAESLQPSLSQLRDKQLTQIDPEQVVEVEIQSPQAELSRLLLPSPSPPAPSPTAEEDPAAPEDEPTEETPAPTPQGRLWEISDQPERQVSLESLFTALNQARAQDFISPQDPRAELALSDPLFTLRLNLENREESLVFQFAEDEEQIYAQVPGRSDILVIEPRVLNSIRSKLEDLKPE